MQTTRMPHTLIAEQAMRMQRAIHDFKREAIADGATIELPIHDEIIITVPTEGHARRILSRLARLMQPALPPPPAGDPVARFLLSTYGTPSTGGAK
jgi:hypothetical protein